MTRSPRFATTEPRSSHRLEAEPKLPRLVVADDDAVVRSALDAQLSSDFDCVGTAADADSAIEMVGRLRPDLAILDVNMPGGGARRATPEIHACSPETAIVILSADETRDDVVELISSGAITYLRKGIDRHTFIERLNASLQAHRGFSATGAQPSGRDERES